MKSCCKNSNWKDEKVVCPCEMRDSLDKYPRCCEQSYNNDLCCNTKDQYSKSYGAKCCVKKFDTDHCCDKFDNLNGD